MNQTTAAETMAPGVLRRVLPWLLLSLALHLLLLLFSVRSAPPTPQWQPFNVQLVELHQHHATHNDGHRNSATNRIVQPRQQSPSAITKRTTETNENVRPQNNTPGATHKTLPHVAAKQQIHEMPNKANSMVHTAGKEEASAEPHQPEQAVATSVPSQSDEGTTEQVLLSRIQLLLAKHFKYPTMAKRHGWQGEVILSFQLRSDGTITNAHIAQSSGYSVLDRAALNALAKVKGVKHSLESNLAMQLPVIYRLEG